MRIPVDAARIKFMSTGKGAGKPKYAELSDGSRKRVPDAFETDDQGRTFFMVDVIIVSDDAARADLAAVKIPAWEEPVTSLGDVVQFINLTVTPYVPQGSNRISFSYSADGIVDPAKSQPKAA